MVVGEASVTLNLRRLVAVAIVAITSQVPISAIAWSGPVAACADATASHHVALVVQHGDGSTLSRCVPFQGAGLTGEQVLQASGVEFKTVSFGGLGDAICRIDGEPATFPPSCWTGTSNFWAFFVARAGAGWTPSNLGVSVQLLHDGDTEGLRYEPQIAPIAPSIMGACPSSTPTPKPSASHPPRPTTTPVPASTPGPSARPDRSLAPSPGPSSSSASLAGPPSVPAESGSPGAIGDAPAGTSAAANPSGPAAPTTSDPVQGPTDQGSPALVLSLAAILGLAGLAAIRRRPGRGQSR